ncbi:MAG: hypothetical protein OEX07_16290, partial [Gammaproteobacteria bacterium]|nr:hypothetical protein [Gammaproteobacteria bacterium]
PLNKCHFMPRDSIMNAGLVYQNKFYLIYIDCKPEKLNISLDMSQLRFSVLNCLVVRDGLR